MYDTDSMNYKNWLIIRKHAINEQIAYTHLLI